MKILLKKNSLEGGRGIRELSQELRVHVKAANGTTETRA
jgi:hypothetical protein